MPEKILVHADTLFYLCLNNVVMLTTLCPLYIGCGVRTNSAHLVALSVDLSCFFSPSLPSVLVPPRSSSILLTSSIVFIPLSLVCRQWRVVLDRQPSCICALDCALDFTCVYWNGGAEDVLALKKIGQQYCLLVHHFYKQLFDFHMAVFLSPFGWDQRHHFAGALTTELKELCQRAAPHGGCFTKTIYTAEYVASHPELFSWDWVNITDLRVFAASTTSPAPALLQNWIKTEPDLSPRQLSVTAPNWRVVHEDGNEVLDLCSDSEMEDEPDFGNISTRRSPASAAPQAAPRQNKKLLCVEVEEVLD
ncbi:hypothetical protein K438DRAFT_1769753 [Mycena galopus ATCC 62051]|nr:hypothetical protein K438DRAFT_1769753 [Mycena galopus ATCC 62051]